MPRPTPAQFVSGTAVTVLSVVAMLLLSGARIPWVVALVACVGLGLGVLVAATLAATPASPEPGPAAAARSGPRTGAATR